MSETQRFERLAQAYFEFTYEANPVNATLLGVHKYDDRLGEFTRTAIQGNLDRTRDFLAQVRQIDAAGLPLELADDRTLLLNEMLTSVQWYDQIADWRRNPNLYVELPLYGFFIQVSRDFAPLRERLTGLLGRLRAFGPLLETAMRNLENPPSVFTEAAMETAEGGLEFFQSVVPVIAAQAPDLETALLAANRGAIAALTNYVGFLKTDLLPRSKGRFGIGEGLFAEKLRVEHMLDESVAEVAALGQRLFDDTKLQLGELAHTIDPNKTWVDLIEDGRQQCPAPDAVFDAYRREMAALRAFVANRDLVTIPPNEELELVETPGFARSTTPYAAYMPPAPMEARQRGQFWVTPVDTTATTELQSAQLKEHCYYAIPSTALHEAFPGHHLQLVVSNNVSDYVRKHIESNLFAEGWALYCEQLIAEQEYTPASAGPGGSDPRMLRLFLLKDQLWRAARILIDVGLHTRDLPIEQAVRLLVDEVKLPEAAARGEVRRYTMSPTQPLSYMMGKLQILRLRDEFRELPLRKFHDLLLSRGTVPLKVVGNEMRAKAGQPGILSGRQPMKELTDRALDSARSRGATYADVRIVERRTQSISVKNGRVEEVSDDQNQGFGVRVVVDGAWGFASSNLLAPAEIDRVAAAAVAIARASSLVKRADVSLGATLAVTGTYKTPVAVDPFAVPLGDKVALLLAADAEMRRVKGIAVAEGGLGARQEVVTFASSEGSYVEQTFVESGAGIEATASGDGDVQRRSYPNSFGRTEARAGFEFVQAMDLPGNAERISTEAVQLLAAKPCPTGITTTLILDGSQVGLQVHESCGHPTELDRVFGSEAAYAGTSFLTTDKLGSFRYGSDLVNITADASVPGGLGTFGYDDEGVPAQRSPLVRQGIFVGYLMDRQTAAELGKASNGCARADGWDRIPLVRMTNVNLEPGTWALADIIADTDDGIYMQTNKSWSIDDKRLNFQFGTEIAWEVKKGRLGAMLKNATYSGITPVFWQSCDAIAAAAEWRVWGLPNCGKGQPSQVAHVGHGAAPARFRNVRVG